MSTPGAALALEKQALLARSAVARLRLRRDVRSMRNALDWRRTVRSMATAPMAGRIVLGLALSLAGPGRAARLLMLAGRMLLAARMARSLFALGRARLVAWRALPR